MAAFNGRTDFETMASPPTKVISLVVKEIQKIRERRSSDSKIADHLLERDGLTKPQFLKIVLKKMALSLRDKDDIP